ncbi:hypothetical protein GWC77_27140 [Paraburkholderia sp. NMBU_R16]|uniref:hypothetical protein n=1 Tax=Paraburkholderia sp. NMBU_R16 TaxID=2698676 RepID=UPI001565027D|nr:hypothetical protein [Paraburkholderia sp. NMBU_R16]NRO99546.1 hypothetical protein [Paraburkholderia sp. NMBU_R16]
MGWYIVPAFVLKYSNPHAQRLISGLWSLIGLFLFFRMLLSLISGQRAKIITPLIFIVFSGADVVGRALTHFRMGPIYHLEWWAGWIKYGSSTTSLFWVPQHAIAVWLGIAMLMRQDRLPTLLPYLIFIFSAISFRSPFAAIGLAPYGAWLIWRNGVRKTVLNWRAIITVMLLVAPLFLYFSASSARIPHGFIGTPVPPAGTTNTAMPAFFLSLIAQVTLTILDQMTEFFWAYIQRSHIVMNASCKHFLNSEPHVTQQQKQLALIVFSILPTYGSKPLYGSYIFALAIMRATLSILLTFGVVNTKHPPSSILALSPSALDMGHSE